MAKNYISTITKREPLPRSKRLRSVGVATLQDATADVANLSKIEEAVALFNYFFEKDNQGDLRIKRGAHSDFYLSAMGQDDTIGGGSSVEVLQNWENYDELTMPGVAMSAKLGYDMRRDIATLASRTHTHRLSEIIGLDVSLSGKAELIHQHSIGDVDGLQSALDGKAGVHAHPYLSETYGAVIASKLDASVFNSFKSGDFATLNANLGTLGATFNAFKANDFGALKNSFEGFKATFESAFDIDSDGSVKAKVGLASLGYLSALGTDTTAGGGGASYDRLDDWGDYSADKVMGAVLGKALRDDVTMLKNAGYITASALSDYALKSHTHSDYALVSHSHSDYALLNHSHRDYVVTFNSVQSDTHRDANNMFNSRSFIGSAYLTTNAPNGTAWYNVIQLAHRNGESDGADWVGQIALQMTDATGMWFRRRRSEGWNKVSIEGHTHSEYWQRGFVEEGVEGWWRNGTTHAVKNSGVYTYNYGGANEILVHFRGCGLTSALTFRKDYDQSTSLMYRNEVDSNRFAGSWKTILDSSNFKDIIKDLNLTGKGSSWGEASTWNAALKYNGGSPISTDSMHGFLQMKGSNGGTMVYGGLGEEVGFYYYEAGRTDNGYNSRFVCETSNGCWRLEGAHMRVVNRESSSGTIILDGPMGIGNSLPNYGNSIPANHSLLASNGLFISNSATSFDAAWIRLISTNESDNIFEIATGDDGIEQIFARQYKGENTIPHEIRLLDNNGNTVLPTGKLFVGSVYQPDYLNSDYSLVTGNGICINGNVRIGSAVLTYDSATSTLKVTKEDGSQCHFAASGGVSSLA